MAQAQAAESGSVLLDSPSANRETVPQRMEGADGEISKVKTVHFGCFNDRIQKEVQNLQTGLSTLDSAIGELTRQFRKYRRIVSTVGDRYGDDEALVKKIDDLETGKKAIWMQAQDDRDSYRKERAEIMDLHANEILDLRAKAEAGSQKKVEYEQAIRDVVEEQTRAEEERDQKLKQKIQDLEKEHQQMKEQWKKDNAQKIANLEKDREELEGAKARLSENLHDRTSERDREKELRLMVQEKMHTNMAGLQGELSSIKKQYQQEQRPLKF
jgi:chromosome segregation ATPase